MEVALIRSSVNYVSAFYAANACDVHHVCSSSEIGSVISENLTSMKRPVNCFIGSRALLHMAGLSASQSIRSL